MAPSPILDSSGVPLARQSAVQPTFRDGVIEAMQAAAGGRFGQFGFMSQMFAPQIAAAAYLTSGMLQKVIELPAADRVREWRDWQAEKEQIEALEAEERRLGIRAKVKEAEILRGLGGGALVLAAPGNPDQPIGQVGKGQLAAVNVVSRDQIELVDIDMEITSPTYRQPKFFRVRTTGGQSPNIHPSRVICFKGAPLPPGYMVSDQDLFWGQSLLMRVYREVEKADNAQAWFAALVKKAKLLRIGIPGLTDMATNDAGMGRLTRRMTAIATGESSLNAVVYEAANAEGKGGEEITDYQITWAGIPAMMDAFDQRVAAVSNIPFTVLMGRSPAGMNSTGDHDRDNWHREVAAGQTLELQPCLDQLDAALIPSALGSRPAELWWKFAPLDSPTEKEEADTFKTTMDAVKALGDTGTIPDIAMSKGVQNLMIERGWMPGLDQALAEVPEAERFPEGPTEEEMRAEIEAEAKARAGGAPTGDRPFEDARPKKHARLARRAAGHGFDPNQPRDRHGRWIPFAVRNHFAEAAAGRTGGKPISVGSVGRRGETMAAKAGVLIGRKKVVLDPSLTRHIILRHGNESRSGQKSVSARDMAAAATLLNGARLMRKGSPAKNGAARFVAMTKAGKDRVFSVFESRKYTVALVTMWVRR